MTGTSSEGKFLFWNQKFLKKGIFASYVKFFGSDNVLFNLSKFSGDYFCQIYHSIRNCIRSLYPFWSVTEHYKKFLRYITQVLRSTYDGAAIDRRWVRKNRGQLLIVIQKFCICVNFWASTMRWLIVFSVDHVAKLGTVEWKPVLP